MSLVIHRNTVNAKYILNNITEEMGIEKEPEQVKDQQLRGYIVCDKDDKYLSVSIDEDRKVEGSCIGIRFIMIKEYEKAIVFQDREQAISLIDNGDYVCAIIVSEGATRLYPIVGTDDLRTEVH